MSAPPAGHGPEPAWPVSARLAEATWPEVEARAGAGPEAKERAAAGPETLLVPLGATEQHGPHLPLSTDSTIAEALATAVAARTPGAVVAPLLPYGSSGEHQSFAGTLSIGAEATELVLIELVRSATETFPRVVFVNAHGGNAEPLAAAVRRLRTEGRDVLAWSPRFGGDAHAGRTETSLMLALAEQESASSTAVREGLAEAGATAPMSELIERLRTEGVAAVSPNGVLGDPRGASVDEGRALFDAAVKDLCATLAASPFVAEQVRTTLPVFPVAVDDLRTTPAASPVAAAELAP